MKVTDLAELEFDFKVITEKLNNSISISRIQIIICHKLHYIIRSPKRTINPRSQPNLPKISPKHDDYLSKGFCPTRFISV